MKEKKGASAVVNVIEVPEVIAGLELSREVAFQPSTQNVLCIGKIYLMKGGHKIFFLCSIAETVFILSDSSDNQQWSWET
jgi:hypothetical protein